MTKKGLVLGGGGLVGMAYHAGVMKALDEWGLDLTTSDVIVGTSAGSIIASYLAAGWTMSDFYEYAHGRHPDSRRELDEQKEEVRSIFTPLYSNNSERVRRYIGSAFAVAAARGFWKPGGRDRRPSEPLRRAFPAGMYSTGETRQRLNDDLPEEWPRQGLYICTVDLYSGKRVAFGHPDAPEASLPAAVLASTAIPGVFPPVAIGGHHYVDGGVASATSLDLATDADCEAILCIAPLGYKSDGMTTARDPKMWGPMLIRSFFARSLKKEVGDARAAGVDVFVIRPWLTDLREHGTNSMRFFDRVALTDSAREGTLRLLEENADHPALRAFAPPEDRASTGS